MNTMKLKPRWILLATFFLLVLTLICFPYRGRLANASTVKNPVVSATSPVQEQLRSVADGGSWSPLFSTANVPVHISLLPDGRLLYWARDKAPDGWDVNGKSRTYLADQYYLDNPAYTAIPSPTPGTNLFCSGHSFLPDGRLIVTGGHIRLDDYPFAEALGEPAINIFDYRTNTWTRSPFDMAKGRWYPYNVTLANGETIALSGHYWNGEIITYNHMLRPRVLPNAEPSIRDLAGGLRTLTDASNVLFPNLPDYPYVSLAPDGKVFIATPSMLPGEQVSNSRMLDPYANNGGGTGVYTIIDHPSNPHTEGTSVTYAPGKVLMVGGVNLAGGPSATAAETIDLSASAPRWGPAGHMAVPRHFPTSTLLPDGTVLITGGTSCAGTGNNLDCGPGGTYGGAVQTPELWDPANPSEWKPMNPTNSSVPRVYHSFALLMPDARVLVGGGGLPLASGETGLGGVICQGDGTVTNCTGAGHKDAEFFSPPYLFNADGSPAIRPSITSAPEAIAYGQTFSIGVGNIDSSMVPGVVLIRLPSVTHTYNQDQRRVALKVSRSGDWLNVIAPGNGIVCPPGPYMMFLISKNRNTPSVAKIVRVGALSLDRTSEAFPTEGGSNGLTISTTAGLNWTAQTDKPWLTITSGTSGTGNGLVVFNVSSNNDGAIREGKITVSIPGQESGKYEFKVYQAVNFSDVSYTDPINRKAPLSISKIYARSVTLGCGGGKYCPNDFITRASMATLISRVLGAPSPPIPASRRFNDVEISYAASKFIEYVARRGVMGGCNPTGTIFCPEALVTRAEMAAFIMSALGVKNPPQPSVKPFDDVEVTHWAAGFIEELRRRGIAQGCDRGNNFCPDSPVTRKDMAVFLAEGFGL